MMKKALFLASLGVGSVLVQGVPSTRASLETSSNLQDTHYSVVLAEGDGAVTILDAGGFKLTASCKTVTFSPQDWGIPSDMSMYTYDSSSSSLRGPRNGPDECSGFLSRARSAIRSAAARFLPGDWDTEADPCGSSSAREASGVDMMMPEDMSFTQNFAGLELTYTASEDDYMFGPRSYMNYPGEDKIVGSFEAGESRTQTVFAGMGDFMGAPSATFQSMSGRFLSVNSDQTIGIHRASDMGMGYGYDYGYAAAMEEISESMESSATSESVKKTPKETHLPEGVECMVAGVITYVE